MGLQKDLDGGLGWGLEGGLQRVLQMELEGGLF